jgi:Transglycosylase-like domain
MAERTLLQALFANESAGKNVDNTTQGTSSGQAQGYFQITTGTWDEFGGKKFADVPHDATYEQQAEIASQIPLHRWDHTTIDRMRATGLPVDTSKTLGQNLALNNEKTSDFNPKDRSYKPPTTEVAANTSAPSTTPAQPTLGSMLGSAFADLEGGGGGGYFSSGSQFADPEDVPSSPSLAAQTNFTASSNPVPAQFSGGAPGLGSQLGLLAAAPPTGDLLNPNVAPSITTGAPSMTAMLGMIGDQTPPNFSDPRRTMGPSPSYRLPRMS